ncbi:unnamed protein product [Phaedon cochleariae]|uniref:Cytochrome P450 n=1 Tax=Phaedon cochleariae TaxID=80249 RepID=A0A9N9SI05_PHACE|nr:unnamed protein product [Phaedon cochleariae]
MNIYKYGCDKMSISLFHRGFKMLTEIAILFASVGIVAILFVKYKYGYWKRKNIPYLVPTFPTGNNTTFFPEGQSIGKPSYDFYQEFKARGAKMGGVYVGIDPHLVILDPEILRTIMIKDFNHFMNRGLYKIENDPLTVNMVTQHGTEWRNARVKFTNVFTSAKIKIMYDTMKLVIPNMIPTLDEKAKNNVDVDVMETMACFTTDAVGSTILGVECNSFKNPNAEFRRLGRHFFEEFSTIDKLRLFVTINFPNLAETLRFSNVQPEVSKNYSKIIKETVEYREKNNVVRKDFLDLLIQLKNSGVQVTMDEIIGQTFSFFTAGFETSATTTTMTLFELAENQEAQNRLREEITSTFEKNNGDMPYEALMGMKYLGQAIDETLRLWPPVPTIPRLCVKDYKFPGTDLTIEKGTKVMIPVLGLHLDEYYYPDPLKWNPDRFEDRNEKFPAYFPFGDGPRHCIGMRFAFMQVRLGLATILKNYKVTPSPLTEKPLDIHPGTFLLKIKQRIYLKFEKIN